MMSRYARQAREELRETWGAGEKKFDRTAHGSRADLPFRRSDKSPENTPFVAGRHRDF
jgi:hypothetical protein